MYTNIVKWKIAIAILSLCIFMVSCSNDVTKTYKQQPESYLSPAYEDLHFDNVSMDICYPSPQYELVEGGDTALYKSLTDFNNSFIAYFPDAIKFFSTIMEVGWVFFVIDYEADIIEYQTKTKDGLDFYVSLPDSLTKFQRESNADFLFLLHYGAFTGNPPDSLNAKDKYSSTYEMEYSIWDRKNLELIAKDRVYSMVEFDKVKEKWPYRAAITKSAALIFEKLPMFEK